MAGILSAESLRRGRRQPRVLAAYVVLLAVFLAVAWHLPVGLWRLYVETRDLAALTRTERALRGPRYVGVDTEVFVAARRLIPEDDVYLVAVGPRTPRNPQAELDAVPRFAAWWLLPRRQTRSLERADWVIAYGVDPRKLGPSLERVDEVGEGIAVAKVRR